jgi:hypothetical protein
MSLWWIGETLERMVTGHSHNAKLLKHLYRAMQIHSRTFAFQKVQSKSQQ